MGGKPRFQLAQQKPGELRATQARLRPVMTISHRRAQVANWAFVVAVSLLGFTLHLPAQIPGGQTGFNPALLQLFGSHKAFTGTTDLRMTDRMNKELVRMPMQMQFLDGKVRAEVNLKQITASAMGEEGLAMFKQAGMEQVVSILRPDRKVSIVAFAPAKVFTQEPMTPEDVAGFALKYEVKLTELGRETINNHPCIKNQVTVSNSRGERIQGTVWNATDLKQFPVKILLPEGDSIIEMSFRDVKLQKPDSTVFEAPAGFTRFESMEKLIQSRLASILGAGKPGTTK